MECGSCHEKHNVIFVCEPAIEHYALRFVHVRVPLAWASWVLGARTLGAVNGSILWWAIMVLNSLFWGGCITQIILPLIKKSVK